MNPILLSEKQRLDSLFDKISTLPVDDEIHAHWSRYLCVLVSGFIENAMRILLTEYTKNKSHPNVSNYVSKQIKGITNLNNEKILQLLGSFDSEWRNAFPMVALFAVGNPISLRSCSYAVRRQTLLLV